MGIFSRYIFVELSKVLWPCWLSLGLVLFVLEYLAQVFNVNTDAKTALILYLYKVPAHLQLVFPVAALFSTLLVVGNMNRSRELTASQSLGFTRWSLSIPVAAAILVASVAHYFVTAYGAPWGMMKHYELYDAEVMKKAPRFSKVRQEKMWYRNQDVLYNVRYFEPSTGELYDVTVYTFDDAFHIAQTIYARKAAWNGYNWILSDGTISLTDKRLETPVTEPFKTRSTRLIDEPKNLARVEMSADITKQPELRTLIQRYRSLGINTAKLEVVFHSRLSFLLVPFVFLLLALPRAMRFRRSHVGAARDGVFVTTVCMLYWLFFNYAVNLGNSGKLSPTVATWVPSVLLLVVVAIYNRSRSLKSETE